jgi:tetratricopeptide (TPR) repeat protein/mono/diheme cytochrome c family protein
MRMIPFVFAALLAFPPRASAQTATFNRHIAPIVFAHCSGCHRPDGGAPFSLLTYEDARQRSTLIARVTGDRYMPPWKPEQGFGEFAGERRLTQAQIALIEQWAAAGAPEGEPADLPAVPRRPGEWELGPPDLVVTMPQAYQLRADGPDVFRTFVVPIPVAAGRYVKGVEFRAGAPRAVHHARIKIDRTRSSRQLDDEDPSAGYDGGGARTAEFPDGQFLSWTPGQTSQMLPDRMGWRLDPGSDLVLELHMMPSGKPEDVRASVGLYFTDQAPSRPAFMLRLGSQSIDIPADAGEYVVTDAFELPVDVEVVAVQPHAHYLARDVKAFARLPDGTTTWLVSIPDWDFRWQDVYRYREPLRLPGGTTLLMRYTYDNSAANARNPNQPPKRVTFGETTASEMGNLYVQVVTRTADDRLALNRAYVPKRLGGEIAGLRKMLEISPEDARVHVDLAFLYLDAGQLADATRHLEEAVRLAPARAWSHHALGTVLLNQRRLEEAKQHFTEAVRLEPGLTDALNTLGVVHFAQGKLDEAASSYADALRVAPENFQARYNLGRVRAAQGRFEDAVAEYRQALKTRADDPDALSGLASALASAGQLDEALTHYRRALELRPDHAAALVDLAWIRATSTRPDVRAPEEAVRLAERVADLSGYQNATVLDTLAVAYYSAGRIDQAIRAAELALDLASGPGNEELAGSIRKRLEALKGGTPAPPRP